MCLKIIFCKSLAGSRKKKYTCDGFCDDTKTKIKKKCLLFHLNIFGYWCFKYICVSQMPFCLLVLNDVDKISSNTTFMFWVHYNVLKKKNSFKFPLVRMAPPLCLYSTLVLQSFSVRVSLLLPWYWPEWEFIPSLWFLLNTYPRPF